MARKTEPEQKSGAPDWLVTYSDMVTLVLTFFVLLFSFSTLDAQKWKSMVSAFNGSPGIFNESLPEIDLGGMNNNPDNPSMGESDIIVDGDIVEAGTEWAGKIRDIGQYIDDTGIGGDVIMEANDYEVIIRVRGDILFDSGRAILKDESKTLILDFFQKQVWPDLHMFSNVRIEGHTDNRPIHTAEFQDNVQLSQRRSWAVWNYLIVTYPISDPTYPKLDPAMLDCNGRGEYHPIDSNDTAEGRARNRRVDFVLVRKIKTVTTNPLPSPSPQP